MRCQYQTATLFDGEFQCGQGFAYAGVVGNDTVFQRHVEIDPNENEFAAEVEIPDGEFAHDEAAFEVNF